jgi:putative lipoprotein (rSAM/lipoprotein system)
MRLRYLFFFAVLVIMTACNKDSEQDWTGMQYYEFEIFGKVTDNSGNPIKGISVSASGVSVLTKADGSYELKGQGGTNTTVYVSFTDVDVADNGGLYGGASRSVELEYVKGKHGPFLGLFRKIGVDVTLVLGLTPVPDPNTPV